MSPFRRWRDCIMDDDGRPTIVHVVNTLDGGGTERTLVALLRAFEPAALRHVVVTFREAGRLAATLPDHVACRPLDAVGRDRFAAFRLRRVLSEERAAVVHARNTGCWFDSLAACILRPRTALILGFHGLETRRPFSAHQRRVGRLAARCGARFTSVSRAGAKRMLHEMAVPQQRLSVLPNGVRCVRSADATANRRAARDEFGFDHDAFVIGGVGSLTSVKRFDVLIDAVARVARCHPHVRLLLIGDGPLRPALSRRVAAARIESNVRLVGNREDVPALLPALDGYVCCSDSEEVSNALLEAMAAGLPIITTDVGDHRTIVHNGGAGFVIGSADADALAERITRWMTDPAMRHRQAEHARRRAQDFDFANTVQAYEAYYRSLTVQGVASVRSASAPGPPCDDVQKASSTPNEPPDPPGTLGTSSVAAIVP